MKIALYIRMSTDKQENSIDSQKVVLEQYAKTQKMQVAKIYVDEGISGRTAEKRPSFMQMIEESGQGLFDAVLIYDSSRFARNLEESIVYKSVLRRNGVKLLSVTEPTLDEDSSLITDAMLGALNEMYSRKLSKSVKRGMVYHAQKGDYQVPPPYGYRKQKGVMNIVEEEAEVVRKVFELFCETPAWHSVAVKLNAIGARKRSTFMWVSRDVKRILLNPAYIGKVVYAGEVYEGKHKPIIDSELWGKVQALIEVKPKGTARPPTGYGHWLSGLMKCPCCGHRMVHIKSKKNTRAYRCWGRTNGVCAYSNYMSLPKLEKLVLNMLKTAVSSDMDYQYLVLRGSGSSQLGDLESALKKVQNKLSRHKEAYSAGVDTLEEYRENKMKCQKEEKELAKQIKDLTREEITNDDVLRLKEKTAEVITILESENHTIEQKSIAIKTVVCKIIPNKYTNEMFVYYFV